MEDDKALNQSIDNAKRHYRSMFTLPSLNGALAVVAVLCIVIGLVDYIAVPSQGLIGALTLSFSLFSLTVIADLIISKVVLRNDPIFLTRRTLFLSLFGLGLWFLFMILGVVLSSFFGQLIWLRLTLLGFAAVITLRIIVFMATSETEAWRRGLAILLQPVLCLIPFAFFWDGIKGTTALQVLPFIVISPVIAFAVGLLFFYPITRLGESYSISSLPLFKAFIADWVNGDNLPLEKFFEDLGEDTDVEVDVLKFESSRPKAAVILSHVHPGPFSNIGSSLLPSLMKHEFQREYQCEAFTPLGILGHERDLASQAQNHKIISQVLASAKFKTQNNFASPMVRASEGVASASCQIFGDTAFITFTLAPETTEDLPQELDRIVSEEAAKLGLKHTLVVNAHNSLTDIVNVEEHLAALQKVAFKCLRDAATQATSQFRVGAASLYPTQEYTLKEGMGSGGITALVVEVKEQKTAYVVIDGNNMISGLREKIITAIGEAGFVQSEILTTDTHAVSAIVTGWRGYHPVGEVMDQSLLIHLVCDVAKKAEANLEASTVGCQRLVVSKVRAIGEARLKSMTTLVDKAIQRIKKTLIPIFGLEGLLLILLVLFI